MPSCLRLQQVTISLPRKDYNVFVAAADILARIMGRKAPKVLVLIEHNLIGRDAPGVADEYLDSIGWPMARGRVATLRRHHLSPVRSGVRRLKGPAAPVDPSNN